MNKEEQIKEILSDNEDYAGFDKGKAVEGLTNLLTKAQGEAVRGFVNYCQYDTDSVERITDYGVNQLQGIADYYLTQQSLNKGDK